MLWLIGALSALVLLYFIAKSINSGVYVRVPDSLTGRAGNR